MASGSTTTTTSKQQTLEEDGQDSAGSNKFRLISWNIDGLDERNTSQRTRAVCDTIQRLAPDVVFLQEVNPETLLLLEGRLCARYDFFPGGRRMYFTLLLIKKASKSGTTTADVQPFPNSKMGRNLIEVKTKCLGVDLVLMTSHLESGKSEANERKRQLSHILGEMQEREQDRVVLFGGDTNLRDNEVKSVGGLPKGVVDLWEACGKEEKTKYTWDLSTNDNLEWQYLNRPKLRFDRVFIRPAKESAVNLIVDSFQLIGRERLPSCGRFPSDHWGIVCDFDVIPAESV